MDGAAKLGPPAGPWRVGGPRGEVEEEEEDAGGTGIGSAAPTIALASTGPMCGAASGVSISGVYGTVAAAVTTVAAVEVTGRERVV